MTDRLNGVTITFEKDIRDDDAESILNAMRMIKGVIHVEPSIVTPEDHMAEVRVRSATRAKFYNFIDEQL